MRSRRNEELKVRSEEMFGVTEAIARIRTGNNVIKPTNVALAGLVFLESVSGRRGQAVRDTWFAFTCHRRKYGAVMAGLREKSCVMLAAG